MEPLNRDTIKAYLIQKKIFPENALLNVIDLHEEIQNIEGYVNLIFAVRDLNTNCSVVVKQLLPYICLLYTSHLGQAVASLGLDLLGHLALESIGLCALAPGVFKDLSLIHI